LGVPLVVVIALMSHNWTMGRRKPSDVAAASGSLACPPSADAPARFPRPA
jgi:hypothetical protein